jgi:hypothetical protein
MPTWHVNIPDPGLPHSDQAVEALRLATRAVLENILAAREAPDIILFAAPQGPASPQPSAVTSWRPKRNPDPPAILPRDA